MSTVCLDVFCSEYADALEYLQLLISASDAAGATSQSFAIGSNMATVTGEFLLAAGCQTSSPTSTPTSTPGFIASALRSLNFKCA